MTVDLSPIDESLLAEIANMHGMPKGAFNVRKDGAARRAPLLGQHRHRHQDRQPRHRHPHRGRHQGRDGVHPRHRDAGGPEGRRVQHLLRRATNCDVTIIAGCGIHNDTHHASEHDGIHTLLPAARTAACSYVEKHYGEGAGTGERILNPATNVVHGGGLHLRDGARAAARRDDHRARHQRRAGRGRQAGAHREAAHPRRPGRHLQHEGGAQGRRLHRAGDLPLGGPGRLRAGVQPARHRRVRPAAGTCSATPSSWATPR